MRSARSAITAVLGACSMLAGGAGPASAGTPQSPQAATFLVSCPGFAPFLATSPTPPSAAGVGTPMTVIPQGIFHGPMPEDLVMICTGTDVSTGEVIGNVPILIAPTRH
jgi:hypothetical protein